MVPGGDVTLVLVRSGFNRLTEHVQTHEVLRRLRTESAWSKVMVLSPDENTLYVANWSGDNVTEIGLRRGKVRRQIPAVDTPRGLYVTPDGKRLFVAGYGDGELQRVDLETGRSKILLRTGGAMRHLVADDALGVLYADDMATDEIYTVDLDTERVRKLTGTDHMPNTIDLTPDGKVLYVSNRGANNPESYYLPGPEWGSVLAIDTATGSVLDAIVGGDQTTGLDVSPDGRMLAYSDFLDNHVSVFAIPAYEALAEGDGGRWKAHLEEIEKS
jgi:DNA-binding beta-propeller fold protein YncE